MIYIFKNKFYAFLISIVDFIGALVTLPFKIFKKKIPDSVNKILLVRLDHIGDAVSSTVVLSNLKAHYRQAKIIFLVASWAKGLVSNNPHVDEVICYDAPWFSRNKKRIFEIGGFFKLAKRLRLDKYDLGFDLRGDVRHILLMTLAGVRFKVGYGITGGGFLLDRKINYRNGIHATEHNLDLLRGMNIDTVDTKTRLYSSKKDEEFIQNFLKRNNIADSDFIAVIHPHAGNSSKNWRDNRFANLIKILYDSYRAKIILLGSLQDKDKNEDIIKMTHMPALNMAGETSLGSIFELAKKASVFIGVDSGPSHIAACAGNPTIVLYSGTNLSQEWQPKGDKVVVIQKDISCIDCEKTECNNNICMDLISVEDVMKATEQVIKIKR